MPVRCCRLETARYDPSAILRARRVDAIKLPRSLIMVYRFQSSRIQIAALIAILAHASLASIAVLGGA